MIGVELEQFFAQVHIALQRVGAIANRVDQRRYHGWRNVITVERCLQRRWVFASLRFEPTTLHDAVVYRGVGVGGRGIGIEVCLKRLCAIGLVVVGRQQSLIVARGERDFLAIRQSHFGKLDVGC